MTLKQLVVLEDNCFVGNLLEDRQGQVQLLVALYEVVHYRVALDRLVCVVLFFPFLKQQNIASL
jgi:hypothetical protein